jgi:protein-disulfide isomerase
MNVNDTHPNEPSDETILASLHRRLAGVEPLVPPPPAWQGGAPAVHPGVRMSVRSKVAFGGLLPLLLIAAVVTVALGAGFAGQHSIGGPDPNSTTITYRLVAAAGQSVSAADLDKTVSIIQNRLQSAALSATVEKAAPDEVLLHVSDPAEVKAATATASARGKLEFVLLPPATYGTADGPGAGQSFVAIPGAGSTIDPSLPAQFTGADLDLSLVSAAADPNQPSTWLINFAFTGTAASRFETWSGQHVNDYFAIVVDGVAESVPYIKSAIVGGMGQIAGDFTQAQAERLADLIRFGELPFPLVEVGRDVYRSGDVTAGPSESVAPITVPSVTTPSDIPSSGRTLGSPTAPVTLDVWNDYQCPACRVFALEVLPKLMDAYVKTGQVKIVYHDLIVIDVVTGGHESADAANAARCAADQGKFWRYQDWLWANQGAEGSGAYSTARLVELGTRAGLDMSTFQTCVENGAHSSDVQAESSAGPAIDATPTVLVNGQQLASADYDTVAAAIKRSLAASSPSPASSSTAASTESPAIAPSEGSSPPAASSPSPAYSPPAASSPTVGP